MRNEELKAKAIEKVYSGTFAGLIDKDGWAKYYEDDFGGGGIEPFGEYDTRNYKTLSNGHSFEWRPKSLSGIENNRGWIRIEEDGSNLPTDEKTRYKAFHFLNKTFNDHYSKQSITTLWQEEWITHYRPIVKHDPPLW